MAESSNLKDIKKLNSLVPMDAQSASTSSNAVPSHTNSSTTNTAAIANVLTNAIANNSTALPSTQAETGATETGEDGMRKQKLVEEFQYLLEKSQSLFSGLRDLPPTGSHRQWRPYFEKTFEVYTKLWKFQQTHRSILEDKSNYGLKRWEVGEIASKIGQLYYHYYLRTSETNYLYEAYVFYEAIHERQYFKDIIEVKNSALMIKKMRYYARFIIVCLLLNKDENVRQLIAELEQLIEEYTKSFKPPDAKEWQMVLEEIRTFTEAEKKLVPINLDRTPDKIQHRLTPDLAERNLGHLPKLRLQEAILVGNYQKQIKFSELTLDMYRMLQSLERKPFIIHPSVAPTQHQKKPVEDADKKDKEETVTKVNNSHSGTVNQSSLSNPNPSLTNANMTTSSTTTAGNNANTTTNSVSTNTATGHPVTNTASTSTAANTTTTTNNNNTVINASTATMTPATNNNTTTTTTNITADTSISNTGGNNPATTGTTQIPTTTNNATSTTAAAVPSNSTTLATSVPTAQTNQMKRFNPHKYLLYRPSLSQLMVYISTAFKDTGDNAALLLYLSADGHAYPERTIPGYGGGVLTSQRSKQTTDRLNTGTMPSTHAANANGTAISPVTSSLGAGNTLGTGSNAGVTQATSNTNTGSIINAGNTNNNNNNNSNSANSGNNTMVINANTNSASQANATANASMPHAAEHITVPPSVHCLHPADLIPFTRKPLFLIVDSDNSTEFKSMPNVFDQPVMCLMSPVEYPSSVQDKSEIGSLFTLFLHTPLLGFCSVSDIGNLDQLKWDDCVRKIAAMEKSIGDLLLSDINVDKNVKRFMSDDFLYCFIVRFVLCGIFLRYHSSFKDDKAFPSSVPPLPESIYVSTEIVTMLGDLTAIADVGTYFSLPAYASSSSSTTTATIINSVANTNMLSSSPTSTMATLVDTKEQ